MEIDVKTFFKMKLSKNYQIFIDLSDIWNIDVGYYIRSQTV